MNRILDSKCKQIEERKAMEIEMQARRREREERRKLNVEVDQVIVSDDAKDQGQINKDSSEKPVAFV